MHATSSIGGFLRALPRRAARVFRVARHGLDGSPTRVQLEITTTCNLRCVHCGLNQENYRHETLSWSSFEAVYPFLRRYRPDVELSGHGESLVCARFRRMFQRVAEAGCRMSFTTNAMLLTPALTEELLAHAGSEGWHAVAISVDAAEPRLFEAIRRGARFEVFEQNLRAFDEAKRRRNLKHPVVTFNTVVTLMNLDELPGIVRLAHSVGAVEVVAVDLLEYDFFRNQRITGDLGRARRRFSEACTEAGRLGVRLTLTPEIAALIEGEAGTAAGGVQHG